MTPSPTSVVVQPAMFLMRLRYGETVGLSRFLKPTLTGLRAARAAKVGATVAASSPVATTLFAHTATGGIVGYLGLGAAAATPVGWVIASAVAAGAASAGASWYFDARRAAAQIPLTLDTGLDALATRLFDLQGALAFRIAAIDGTIAAEERTTISSYFVEQWGYAPDFVAGALQRLEAAFETTTIAGAARGIAEYLAANPDCNADAMLADLVGFLHELVVADGRLDESETLAVDAAVRVFAEELGLIRSAQRGAARWRHRAERTFETMRERVSGLVGPKGAA